MRDCKKTTILILGLGNILLKDEGIGVHIVEELKKKDLPEGVEVLDGGTSSLDVLLTMKGVAKLVVIDALKGQGKPGDIYRIRVEKSNIDDLRKIFQEDEQSKISAHQINLVDALTAAEKVTDLPEEITVIGIEPKETGYGLELTPEIKRKVPEIINIAIEETKK